MEEGFLDDYCGSIFWDKNLTWNTESPQLTSCFEKTVLVWSPCAFLFLFAFVDIYYIFTSRKGSIPWNWRNLHKLFILGLLALLFAFDLMYNFKKREEVFLVDLLNPLLKLIVLVLCSALVLLQKKYGQRTSGLLFLFWLSVAIFGFPQFYRDLDIFLISNDKEVSRFTYMASYCLSLLMLFFHSIPDLPSKYTECTTVNNPNPEESASYPSRLTLLWFDNMIYKGFRRPLLQSDLWPIKYQDSSAKIFHIFDKHWRRMSRFVKKDVNKSTNPRIPLKEFNGLEYQEGHKESSSKPTSIIPVLLKGFGGVYIIATIMQIIEIFLSFTSPQLLKYMINFVSNQEPIWRGYLYALLLFVQGVVMTLLHGQYSMNIMLVGLRIRTALISAIYRKALKLSNATRKGSTLGEIVNLMSVDAQWVMNALTYLNYLWFAPLQIGLSLYFLWQVLGPCVLAGFTVMIIMIPLNSVLMKKTKTLQVKQMKNKDERIKMMNEVLSGMKVLKLYAWEPSFEERILNIRNKEIKVLRKTAYLRAASAFVWASAPFLVTILTFTAYVLLDERNTLDSSKVFVSISLFSIMQTPLIMVPMVLSTAIQALVSVKRINKFLNTEDLDLNAVTHDSKDDEPLVMEKGSFSWGPDEDIILSNISLKVKPGSLVAVVGAVGSGKSSLISAFLGEMYKVSGRVNTRGSIAYVSQLSWIQNCSFQENILFGKALDSGRYNKVINACALKMDLEMLPGGDQTEIGERGINVSGGQKQRISLARAVYSDCDIYFLDDPLSAVDSHVGKHIFENVIGPDGVLRNKIRFLITHNITFLPEVDMILVLKNGTISEFGTYYELLIQKGAFSEFLTSHMQKKNKELEDELVFIDEDTNIIEDIVNPDPEFHRQLSTQISVNSSTLSLSSIRKRRPSQLSEKNIGEKPISQKLIEEEKMEVGRIQWKVYYDYFRAVGLGLCWVTILLIVINQVLLIGSNVLLSVWTDDKDLIINGTQNINKRNMYLGMYGIIGIFQTITNFISSLTWFNGAVKAGALLHAELLINIMRSPMSFFDTTPQGRILNRLSKEVDVLDNSIPHFLKNAFSFLAVVIGTLCIISYSTPTFIMVIIPIGFIYYWVLKCYITTSQQLRRIESVTRSPVYSHFGESVSGSSLIRAYGVQKRFIEESDKKVDLNQSSTYASIIAGRWLGVRLQLIGTLIVFFASLLTVIGKDYLSPGLVGLSINYTLEITMFLYMFVVVLAEVETNIVAVERMKEYSLSPQEAAWDINPSPAKLDWPQEGKIELVDYKVRYREGLDLVLKGINFVIAGGEKIGIVGRTGAGKSSITLSLFRIIEPANGKILIDGVDATKLGLHTLRSHLTIIPQDPVLFSGTLRMNLDPFNYYNDVQIWRALELAHLKTFVKGCPAGLQQEVSEGGENLSVGQRQLVCLARALLRKTKILILDEATAAIDLETDDFIQKTIRTEFADCTVLTIAHRINTIMDSDRVLVLDKGKVVEFEPPEFLLKNKSSIFYGMVHDAGLT